MATRWSPYGKSYRAVCKPILQYLKDKELINPNRSHTLYPNYGEYHAYEGAPYAYMAAGRAAVLYYGTGWCYRLPNSNIYVSPKTYSYYRGKPYKTRTYYAVTQLPNNEVAVSSLEIKTRVD